MHRKSVDEPSGQHAAGERPLEDERRFHMLVDAVTEYAIYMMDCDGRVTSWNTGAERIKGYLADEIIGEHFSRFFTEADQQAQRPAKVLELARQHGRHESEGWRVRKDGSRFWALAMVSAVRDQDGRLVGFAKVTRDMTERRLAQQALEDSERRFRLLVTWVTDYAIFMLDPNGVVTNWNQGAERIKGYAAHEIVGQYFSRFYTPEDRAAGLPGRALATAMATGKFESEGWRVRKDGSRFWASVVIDAIHDESGQLVGFAKITRDITERRRAQELLEQTREQLAQAQKLEAIGQLTGGIAHDFNNLLMVVNGHVEILRSRLADPQDVKALDAIQRATARGESLTRHLLAFSRRQRVNPTVIDLALRIEALRDMLAQSLRGDIEITTSVPADIWPIEVDPGELDLALLNIAVNARDAMPAGGVLTVSAENVSREHSQRRAGLDGELVALTIADTGTGIAPDVLPKVFEPFFTTKEIGKGTGLGLSQVYGFARQAGGSVTAESELGRGTAVTLYLPRSHRAPSEPDPATPADISAQGHGIVLVVEDNGDVGDVSQMLLEQLGYAVKRAETAEAALAQLDAGEHIDVVFTDIVMPGGMSGLDLARVVRERHPRVATLLTSGYSKIAQQATDEGFRILSKPFEAKALAAAVQDVMSSLHA
jgi:PAS domain S-box-containing protein